MNDAFEIGYQEALKTFGVTDGAISADLYVNQVQQSIDNVVNDVVSASRKWSNAGVDVAKGFIAEEYHAGTYNVDVAVKMGNDAYAYVLRNNDPRVDIIIRSHDQVKFFQSKYFKTPEATANAISAPQYEGVSKVVPADQLPGIQDYAHRRSLRDLVNRPDMSRNYQDTADNSNATISSGNYSSRPLTEQQAKDLAKEAKSSSFDPKKYGLSTENMMDFNMMLQQAGKAGLSAAAITVVLKTAPELVKLFLDRCEIDQEQIKRLGVMALSSSSQAFLSGAIAALLVSTCKSGLAGAAMQTISPVIIGTVTAIVMNSIYNAFSVATGKMTAREYADICTRDIFVASCAVGCAFFIQSILPIPVFGALLGNFIGGVLGSVIYSGIKTVFMSFCVEYGFTFFGLVEQNYEIPKNILMDLGLSMITHSTIKHSNVTHTGINYSRIQHSKISVSFLRRGVIGVNAIGYESLR